MTTPAAKTSAGSRASRAKPVTAMMTARLNRIGVEAGYEEAAEGVQDAGRQGGEGDEEQVREHDPGHEDRQAPFPSDVTEPVGDDLDQAGRAEDAQGGREGHDQGQVPEEDVAEAPEPPRPRSRLSSVKAGTKAGVIAPSPVRRRKRLGMVKAMVKASALLPVPR